MSKIRIPNSRGHYELDGFEVDVDDRDIIIRTSSAKVNKERFIRDQQHHPLERKDPAIGPVSSGILRKFGLIK